MGIFLKGHRVANRAHQQSGKRLSEGTGHIGQIEAQRDADGGARRNGEQLRVGREVV